MPPPKLNAKDAATLKAVFASPTPADVSRRAIVALTHALGGETVQRAGSRVGFKLNGRKALLHQPHGSDPVPYETVRYFAAFLDEAGFGPAASPKTGP